MPSLSHRIRVFVYRVAQGRPDYLLLRSAQGIEGCWTPIHGPIGFGEKLETAIRREVMDDTGLGKPAELVDLEMPSRWVVGDEEVIEWNFGFRIPQNPISLRLDPRRWTDFRFLPFPAAYPTLELDHDRAAIMRLHALLNAA
jgi:hypothetical protein